MNEFFPHEFLGVYTPGLGNLSQDEIQTIAQAMVAMCQARQDFLEGKISFTDLLDLYEAYELDMDDFLELTEENAYSLEIL